MKNLRKFVYLEEFDKVGDFDFSKLTLKERLLFSAILTKYRYDDERPLGEIIWNYDGFRSSFSFESYDELITDIYDKGYAEILSYIKKNAKLKEGKKYKINSTDIDYDKIFLTRNGKHGRSLNSISCKAFMLGAANSKIEDIDLLKFSILDWANCYSEKTISNGRFMIRKPIVKWMKDANISGEFRGNYCIVYSKNEQGEKPVIKVYSSTNKVSYFE